jgi:hypothetical protein
MRRAAENTKLQSETTRDDLGRPSGLEKLLDGDEDELLRQRGRSCRAPHHRLGSYEIWL